MTQMKVSQNMKARIIAELCQNHNGDVDLLENMIQLAKDSGATYAKIQGLYSDELVFRKEFETTSSEDANNLFFHRPFEREQERLRGLDLTQETESWFVEKCFKSEIIPMITVFSHAGVNRAFNAGFKSIKIASYDCSSLSLIRRCAEFAEELVISTGATYWDEITQTSNFLRTIQDKVAITLMHATTLYPTPLESVNMKKLLLLKSLGFNIGFSDHTNIDATDLLASKTALVLGASLIERHFTALEKKETRDGVVSLNPSELQRLSDIIDLYRHFDKHKEFDESTMKEISSLLSQELETDLSPEEIRNRNYYRGRVASFSGNQQVFAWEAWPSE
jgi:N,N'-diacetyllegionaminate synthase